MIRDMNPVVPVAVVLVQGPVVELQDIAIAEADGEILN